MALSVARDPARLLADLNDAQCEAVQITAGPEACEDCLIPRSMMESMIETAVNGAGLPLPTLDVVYPVEGPASSH